MKIVGYEVRTFLDSKIDVHSNNIPKHNWNNAGTYPVTLVRTDYDKIYPTVLSKTVDFLILKMQDSPTAFAGVA